MIIRTRNYQLLALTVLAMALMFPEPAASLPGDAKDMKPDTWTGEEGRRWVKFGNYTWRVLNVAVYTRRKEALLLTEEPVAERAFDSRGYGDWIHSDIRKWLNEDFYNSAFSESERDAILIAHYYLGGLRVTASRVNKQTDSTKIFLLSLDEVENYFVDYNDRVTRLGNVTCWWWLRSPGLFSGIPMLVNNDGNYMDNALIQVTDPYGIRPALFINLSHPIFTSPSSKYETLYDLR
jgi:hypothetical protein